MSRADAGPVRVLVVDDSALIRKLLADMLRASPAIEVAGAARDGAEALELAASLRPDVVTLDVEMPGMSGLDVLPLLISRHNLPVVMVSALTQVGADVTLAALELGAVDVLPKPDRTRVAELKASGELLVAKVLSAARSRVRRTVLPTLSRIKLRASASQAAAPTDLPCIALGISTGGPQALSETLPLLAPPLPPLVIVQHMPALFTPVFADRLGRKCQVPVKEAAEGTPVLPDQILIAPGGRHLAVTGRPGHATATLSTGAAVSGHRPSIDVLFQSVARVFGAASVGIIMTGMGRDGVEGCKRILSAGGVTFGQDEATSVVYGMNKAAFLEGAVREQFPLDDLPFLIERLTRSV